MRQARSNGSCIARAGASATVMILTLLVVLPPWAAAEATKALDCSSLVPSLIIRRRRNSVSSSGSAPRGCQTVESFWLELYTSSMPRWVMKISVLPSARRSKRVRNLSRSLVEYNESNTLPRVLRITSWGSLARFSAQSVSRMPRSGFSCSRLKPWSIQNSRAGSHSCSTGRFTSSQRLSPSRRICTSPTCKGAERSTVGTCACPACSARADTDLSCVVV